MDKAPDAFRTISEVAEHLETPAHVLRFWESRFPQIRPVKRAGGRRYYRPADVALLTGIKRLLHDEGLTIRGVQKILREQGVRHVAGLSGEPVPDDIEMDAEAALEAALAANFGGSDEGPIAPERAVSATIVALESALRRSDAAAEAEPATDPWQSAALPVSSEQSEALDVAVGLDQTNFADPSDAMAQPIVQPDLFKTAAEGPAAGLSDSHQDSPAQVWLAVGALAPALRALPADAFARNRDQAASVQARLLALHQRLLAPPIFAQD